VTSSVRRGRAVRDGLRWLAAGGAAAVSVIVVELTLHALVGWPAGLVPAAVGAAALPVLGAFASIWKRSAGLGGRVLVDTLAAGTFTVIISAVYLVIVRGLGNPPTGAGDRETLGLSMVAAALVAVSFGPARRRFLAVANRVVFGSRQGPDELIRAFSSRLTRSTPMEELLLQLAESLVRAMDVTRADVYTGSGQVLEWTAGVPEGGGRPPIVVTSQERPAVVRAAVSGNAWIEVWLPALAAAAGAGAQLRVAPIRNAGELLGLIAVERAPNAEPFTEDDDRILGDLAREVGLALHNVHLDAALQDTLAELRAQAAALRESRARIVASGDAERRRVERNLHDGAQQNLVALAIGLRLARDLLESDPQQAAQMLDQMNGEVQNAVAELRELAHGIYPPLLVDGGLAPALQAAAARNPLRVEVDVATPDRFDQDTEAAVYFCCLEALQNSAKHASGATARIRVWHDDGSLFFYVGDDGPGFDAGTTPRGQGLINMTDRVGAIGGSVAWKSQPGRGVEVTGSVPVATDPAGRAGP
jgi:signal transduction histidine kinase